MQPLAMELGGFEPPTSWVQHALELLDGGNLPYPLSEHLGVEARIEAPEDWLILRGPWSKARPPEPAQLEPKLKVKQLRQCSWEPRYPIVEVGSRMAK